MAGAELSRVAVTVVVPSHDNGATLRVSVASALAQTHADLEVLVVGDGISEEGREAARELEAADPRVRLLEFPKGERHGEAHRHEALETARGDRVFYLSDDDIWLPDHVVSLLPLLDEAGFVGATVVRVGAGGGLDPLAHDLGDRRWRQLFLAGKNRLPLSGAAHTMSAYRGLSAGWRPAPPNLATDLHFFRGFLENPACTAASSPRPTVLNFPAGPRSQMSRAERLAELEGWWERVSDPAARLELEEEIAASWQDAAVDASRRVYELKHRLDRLGGVGDR